MRLKGHRASLVSVALVPFENERAVTADVEGSFRLWSIDRKHGALAPCLQVLTYSTILCACFLPIILCVCDINIHVFLLWGVQG